MLSEILTCAKLFEVSDVLEFVNIMQRLDHNVLGMQDGKTNKAKG